MKLKDRIKYTIRKLLARSRKAKWDRTQDVNQVFAELKRSAIYSAVPYGVGTATWKAIEPSLQDYLPQAVYQGLTNGIDSYAIPLCGLAIGIYITWRGLTAYKRLRRLVQGR